MLLAKVRKNERSAKEKHFFFSFPSDSNFGKAKGKKNI